MKLTGKIRIKGAIKIVTGLHIGGNKSSLEIGGVDLNVVKTGRGKPFIPGSSLKGKMRSLLAKVRGYPEPRQDDDAMRRLFGDSGGRDNLGATRLVVRDAVLNEYAFDSFFGKKHERILDFDYSEIKSENTIDRVKGSANPRQLERVPAGAMFNFEMVLDIYDGDILNESLGLIKEAMILLNNDYLGGHGTRGSGQVNVSISEIKNVFGNLTNDVNLTAEWQELFPEEMDKTSNANI